MDNKLLNQSGDDVEEKTEEVAAAAEEEEPRKFAIAAIAKESRSNGVPLRDDAPFEGSGVPDMTDLNSLSEPGNHLTCQTRSPRPPSRAFR